MSSIFGNTYDGVVSPQVFHQHPYPTRYHGMNLTVPRFDLPYRPQPYAVPSFMGVGASPDGLGSFTAASGVAFAAVGAVGGLVTGVLLGALIGGIGYDSPGKGAIWGGAVGAVVGGVASGVVGASIGKQADTGAAYVQSHNPQLSHSDVVAELSRPDPTVAPSKVG